MSEKTTIALTLDPVDISSLEKKGPIKILVRDTENRRYDDEVFFDIEENIETQIELKNSIPNRFPKDACVWFELCLKTDTGYKRAAQASLSYSSIKEESVENLEMRCFNLVVNNENPVKANLKIDCRGSSGSSSIKKSMPQKFVAFETNTQYIEKNAKLFEGLIQSRVDEAMKYINMKPISNELNEVAAPYENDCITAPTELFFVDRSFDSIPIEESERYFLSNLRISMRRNNMTEEHFNECVDAMMEIKDFSKIREQGSLGIHRVTKVVSDAMTITSVSRNYGSDETIYHKQKKACEIFQRAERLEVLDRHSGVFVDCEDSAMTILSNCRGLQKLHGKFKEKTTTNASIVANMYVYGATLATVTGSQLADANGNPLTIHIGDKEEEKLQIGAHMFVLAMPLSRFQGRLFEEDKKSLKVSKIQAKLAEISSHFPHHVLEGTGSLNPNIFPTDCYVGGAMSEEAFGDHVSYIKAQISLGRGSCENILQGGKMQKYPELEDEVGKQPIFIRTLSDFIAPQFGSHGRHFIFTDKKKTIRGSYLRNVCLKDQIGKKATSEPFYADTKLGAFPDAKTKEQIEGLQNMEKNMPASVGNKLTEQSIKVRSEEAITESGSSRKKLIEEFNEKSKQLTLKRSSTETRKVTLYYIRDEFYFEKDNKSLRTPKILSDIANNKNIISASARLEFVSECIHVVDLDLELDISKLQYTGKKHKKQIASFIPESFIDGKNIFAQGRNEKKSIGTKANFMKKIWINAHSDDNNHTMDHFNKLLEQLLRVTQDFAQDDPDYRDEMDNHPEDFEKTVKPYYGFRAVVALLKMPHIQNSLSGFLEDKKKARAVVLPFLSVDDTFHVDDILSMGEKAHLSVVLDHAFYYNKMLPQKLDRFDRFPTMNKNSGKYLLIEHNPGTWPDSNAELRLVKIKELSWNSSNVPLINWLDPECTKHTSSYGFLQTDKKLNIDFYATEGLIVDEHLYGMHE